MATRQNAPGGMQKVKLPFFGSPSNRGTSTDKDQRFVNCFPESRKTEQTEITKTWLIKRPAAISYKQFTNSGDPARGVILFNDKMYAAYGSDLYEDDPFGGGGTPTSVITFTTYTGTVGMVLGNSSITGDYLFVCDGVEGWVIDSTGTVTQITDLDFPTPHIASPVFLDGYIILAKGSDLYSCVVDDPTAWNASNFVSAESFPDAVVGLARQNNQIVAFGSESTEFFYNANNVSGSPFNKNEAALIQIGCASKDTICQTEKYCSFLGQSKSGGYGYWILEGFQPRKVSDEFVERVLNSETTIENTKGYCCRVSGHMFYILNLYTADRTFVYDPDEKLWHEWTSLNNNKFDIDYLTDGNDGFVYGQWNTSGHVVKLDPTEGADSPDTLQIYTIPVIIRTNRIDMDTINRKRLHSLRVFMDSLTDDYMLVLNMFDDDYVSTVGGIGFFVNKSTNTDTIPIVYRLGQFRRRAFQFTCYSTDPSIRFEAMELCYTEGTS